MDRLSTILLIVMSLLLLTSRTLFLRLAISNFIENELIMVGSCEILKRIKGGKQFLVVI